MPTDWCAPIVTVLKYNGKVRLCVDFTKLKEGVKWENFTTFCRPTISWTGLSLNIQQTGLKQQVPSNSFTWGFLETDHLYHTIWEILLQTFTLWNKFWSWDFSSWNDTHFVWNTCDRDDVLVSERNLQEHHQRLKMVLQRMEAAAVTLNQKCVFSVSKIKFIGHIISKEVIQVDPEKIVTVNLARPQNVSELWRLLGIANHVGKFAKDLAETTKPLRDLLRKDTAWIRDEPQKTTFQTLKEKLSLASVLIHYSADKETKISIDESTYGLDGVLLQKQRSDWRPVFYASWFLTET